MAIFVRGYTILPIILMVILQCFITKKLIVGSGNMGDHLLEFIPYGIMTLVSAPILPPVNKVPNKDEQAMKRKKWFLYDSITTFLVYGSTLFIVIIIWWLKAS